MIEGSWRCLRAAGEPGLRRAVVVGSVDTSPALRVTGLAEHLEGGVDGRTPRMHGRTGAPASDRLLAGARCAPEPAS